MPLMPPSRRGAMPAVLLLVLSAVAGCGGTPQGPGEVRGRGLPQAEVASRVAAQRRDASHLASAAHVPAPAKQVLFGDLHVHSTWSADAAMMALPLMQGQGEHPVADACDFARYCSALDFWAITDHAESLTPGRWRETVETIRRCNEVAEDPANPDLVSFLGWEWTQIGLTAGEHYGHRNVLLRDLADDQIPRRPVGASGFAGQAMRDKLPWGVRWVLPWLEWSQGAPYRDFVASWNETRELAECPASVPVRDVAGDCMDFAATPAQLHDKLRQWGSRSMVIPHAQSWGLYTPPGWFQDKSLRMATRTEPGEQLVELVSGDGNTEEYRPWREATLDPRGHLVCPEPTASFEPCCWRAGEIVRAHCPEPASAACEASVEEARRNFLAAGVSGHLTLESADVSEWGACGQCRDCFLPPFEHRPGGSAQYALALTDFSDPGRLGRARVGFLGSSDNHSARPGAGYKEFDRVGMTDSFGPRSAFWQRFVRPGSGSEGTSEAVDARNNRFHRYQLLDFERSSSFRYTGGLVAVHAAGRTREAVWDALERREVYATSGERILLWFDLERGGGDRDAPMGADVDWSGTPRFRVRALGSPQQAPGCPDGAVSALGGQRLASLCGGECYRPTRHRHRITRLEVVRILPQSRPGEPLADLVEDPWKVISCEPAREGCVAEFEDPAFAQGGRDALYYVRAIQEPAPAINGGGVRCADAACTQGNPCYGDWRTPATDDCLAPTEERAWSSPIYLAWKAGSAAMRASSPR